MEPQQNEYGGNNSGGNIGTSSGVRTFTTTMGFNPHCVVSIVDWYSVA